MLEIQSRGTRRIKNTKLFNQMVTNEEMLQSLVDDKTMVSMVVKRMRNLNIGKGMLMINDLPEINILEIQN